MNKGAIIILLALLLTLGAPAARGYTGPVDVTAILAASDGRVNPSQSVYFTAGPIRQNATHPVGSGNSSLIFDGVNQYVSATTTGLLTATGTVELWFNATDYTPLNTLISMRTGAVDELRAAIFGDIMYIEVGDSSFNFPTVGITEGVLHHLIFTWNLATQHTEAYIDGVSRGSSNAYTVAFSILPTLTIAARDDLSNYLTGGIDEARIYTRVLSSTEIPQHYQGRYLSETGLIMHLDFDGETQDQSGSGNHGTPHNAPVYRDGWAWLEETTAIFNVTTSGGGYQALVNSTTGIGNIPCTAPATYGNYTAELGTPGGAGNATYVGFLVDTIIVEVTPLVSVVEEGTTVPLQATGTSLIDGHTLGAGDSLTINGLAFTWDADQAAFTRSVTSAFPTTHNYDTLTAMNEATHGITTGIITGEAHVRWTANLVTSTLAAGDFTGFVVGIYTTVLGEMFYGLIIFALTLPLYIRYQNIGPPLIVALLCVTFLEGIIPPEGLDLVRLLTVLGVAVVLYWVFTRRESYG